MCLARAFHNTWLCHHNNWRLHVSWISNLTMWLSVQAKVKAMLKRPQTMLFSLTKSCKSKQFHTYNVDINAASGDLFGPNSWVHWVFAEFIDIVKRVLYYLARMYLLLQLHKVHLICLLLGMDYAAAAIALYLFFN